MIINSCPYVSLQMGVKIVSVLDGVLALLKIFRVCVGSIKVFGFKSDDEDELEEVRETISGGYLAVNIMITIVALGIHISMMILAVKLFRHAQTESYNGCRIWLMVTVPLVTILSSTYVIIYVLNPLSALNLGNALVSVVFKLLEIFLVYLFTKQFSQQYDMNDKRMEKKPSIKHGLPC